MNCLLFASFVWPNFGGLTQAPKDPGFASSAELPKSHPMVKTKRKAPVRSPSEEDDESEPTRMVKPQRSIVADSEDSSTDSDSEGSM